MNEFDLMYDETEETSTRFVGFIGMHSRFDLAITTTQHFFGKKLVYCLQSGRSSILTAQECEDTAYICQAFHVSEDEGVELAAFLAENV